MATGALAEPVSRPVMMEVDFDCDGTSDMALSDAKLWGNAGGDWRIHIKQPDGRYVYAGSLFFHPLAFNVVRQKAGVGIMTVYLRAGGGEGALVTYEITREGVKELSSEEFRPMESESDSPNHKRYEALFSGLRQKPLHRFYESGEITLDGDYVKMKKR